MSQSLQQLKSQVSYLQYEIAHSTSGPPSGTNFGDYIYWTGQTYAVGDATINIGGFAGQTQNSAGNVCIGQYAGQYGCQAG